MSRYRENYTLFKRGKFWYYRTYDERGVRTTAKTTGQTNKTLAREYCEQLYLSGGLNCSSELFGAYAAHFFDDNSTYLKDRIKPLAVNTLISYRSSLNKHIMPVFKDTKLKDISYSKLKAFRAELLENKTPASAKLILVPMEIILSDAFRNGAINKNPFDLLEPLQKAGTKRGCFTREQIKELLSYLPEQNRPLVIGLACTGMRIAEGFYISDSDIRTADGFSYIHLTRQKQHGEFCELKTKQARDIPIIEELRACFAGNRDDINNFSKNVQHHAKKIKSEGTLSCHSLRHFFITDAKSKGVNNIKVEFIAGHSLKGIEATYTNFKVSDLTDILSWQQELFNFLTK